MKRILSIFITVCFGFCCLSGCGSGRKAAQPLRIGLLSIDDSLPFFMAQELGLFEKHGVDVELIPFGSASDKEAALEAGQLDGDMTDLIVTALLKKGGTDVKVVSIALGATPSEGRFLLLSAPESGITDVADLSGVPVAVGDNTIVHYLSDTVLAAEGLSPDDITSQNIPNLSLRYETLMNGSIPAAVLPDPLASLAAMEGANIVFDDTAAETNLSQSVVIFTQASLDTRREEIEKAMAACWEAMTYINENPDADDVRGAISEFTSVPANLFEIYATPSFTPGALPDETIISSTMDWMIGEELLAEGYSYEEMVDGSFGYDG